MSCEHIEELISGYLDKELTQQDSQRVSVHLEGCEKCRGVCQDFMQLKTDMGELSYPVSDEEMLSKIENDLTAKSFARIGWSILVFALVVLCGFLLFRFFVAAAVPIIMRVIYAVLIIGGVLLFISVLRQRLITYKNDKYKKVKL